MGEDEAAEAPEEVGFLPGFGGEAVGAADDDDWGSRLVESLLEFLAKFGRGEDFAAFVGEDDELVGLEWPGFEELVKFFLWENGNFDIKRFLKTF